MIFLENEYIKASFATKGAEIQSLINKQSGLNYLWSGNAAFWGKFSPVLFPIVGALKNDTYSFEGRTYHLSRHGFARDYDFELIIVGDHELIFKLTHNDETLKVYPFEFTLQLRYRLEGAVLSCRYEVINTSNSANLLFSVGGHPALAVPLSTDLNYDDYFLKFNKDSALTYHKIDNNLITDETDTIDLVNNRLPLKHELFYDDALVFKSLKSDSISLISDKTSHGLRFNFTDFPFFGIWAAKDADFVCLEPWCGIADGIHHDQDLRRKEGIIELPAQESWSRKWEIDSF